MSHILPSLMTPGPEDTVGDTQAWGQRDVSQIVNHRGVRFVLCSQGGLPGGGYAMLGFERRIRHSK